MAWKRTGLGELDLVPVRIFLLDQRLNLLFGHRPSSPKRVSSRPGRTSQTTAAPGACVPGDCHPKETGPCERSQIDRGRRDGKDTGAWWMGVAGTQPTRT